MHEAMGHPGQNSLSVLQIATTGSSFRGRGPSTVECDVCALAKASQIINRDPGKTYPIQAPFEQVNIDLFSFIKDQSNYKYILIVVDSWTGFTLAYSLKQKYDSRNAISEAIAFVSTQFNRKIKTVKLNNETSLKTEEFLSKINRLGIVLSTSAPYTSQQNGRSERVGGEVIRRARAIFIQSKFPTLLWCELVKTARYLLNRTPRYRLGNKTPFEIVFKKQPDASHVRPISFKAYYLLKGPKAPPKLYKLSARASVGYLIGYDGANKFRVWNPILKVVVVTRDVTFDESTTYDPTLAP
ncbi:hypothetical protein K3495_g4033 [Podosphaera aphanis]|nr:hypothetical protein K3495_g4033 [Podosphaera aphanis]